MTTPAHRPPPGHSAAYLPRFPHDAVIRSVKFPARRFVVSGIEWRNGAPVYRLRGIEGENVPSYPFDAATVDKFYEPAPNPVPLPGHPWRFNVGDRLRYTGRSIMLAPEVTVIRRQDATATKPARYLVRGPQWRRWNSAVWLEASYELAPDLRPAGGGYLTDGIPREVTPAEPEGYPFKYKVGDVLAHVSRAAGERRTILECREAEGDKPAEYVITSVTLGSTEWDANGFEHWFKPVPAECAAQPVRRTFAAHLADERRRLEAELATTKRQLQGALDRLGDLTRERDAERHEAGVQRKLATDLGRSVDRLIEEAADWRRTVRALEAKAEEREATVARQGGRIRHYRGLWMEAKRDVNTWRQRAEDLQRKLNVARGGPIDIGGGYIATRRRGAF